MRSGPHLHALSRRSASGPPADLRSDLEHLPRPPHPGVRDSEIRRRSRLAELFRAAGRGHLPKQSSMDHRSVPDAAQPPLVHGRDLPFAAALAGDRVGRAERLCRRLFLPQGRARRTRSAPNNKSFIRTGTRWRQLRCWAGESAAWRSATTSGRTSASSTRRTPTTAGTSTAKSRTDASGTMARMCPTRRTSTSRSSSPTWSVASSRKSQAEVVNYFKGHWIDHPAQSNLYQIPEPLRTQCLNSFLESRVENPADQARAGQLRGVDSSRLRPGLRRHVSGRLHPQVLDDASPPTWARTGSASASTIPKVEDVTSGRQGPARPVDLLGQSLALPVEGRLLHLHPQAGGGRPDRVRQETGLRQFPEAAARIRGRHAGEFRDAGLHPAAAGADSVRRGCADRCAGGRVDAEGHPAAAGAGGGQPSVGAQGALAVRLRRGQDQHAGQHPGELLSAQCAGRQDRAVG